jgi:hypothetical protein
LSAPRPRSLPAASSFELSFVEGHRGCLTNSQLLDRLVLEKLEPVAEEVMREGWG